MWVIIVVASLAILVFLILCVPLDMVLHADIYGKPKFLYTAEGIEGFDTMMLSGIHAKPGTKDAVMAHSWIPKALYDFRVNGVSMGEIGVNALVAGHWGIPVSLVSGDQATCDEARALLGEVETVAVKRGTGGFAAYCPHPEVVRQELKEAARRALKGHSRFAPYALEKPLRMEFDFVTHHQAVMVALIPGAEMVSSRTVAFTAKDFIEGMKTFLVAGYVSAAETDTFY